MFSQLPTAVPALAAAGASVLVRVPPGVSAAVTPSKSAWNTSAPAPSSISMKASAPTAATDPKLTLARFPIRASSPSTLPSSSNAMVIVLLVEPAAMLPE